MSTSSVPHVRAPGKSTVPTAPRVVDVNRVLDILDRPIAFHRVFVELTGSVTAGLMLSQGFYWTRIKRRDEPESHGWFYKTQDEWEEETGLSRSEQETARKRLRQTGFWQEKRRDIPAKLYFHLDLDRLVDAILQQPPTTSKQRKNSQQNRQNAELPHTSLSCSSTLDRNDVTDMSAALPPTITEITTETTWSEVTANRENNVLNVASDRTKTTGPRHLSPREQDLVDELVHQFNDEHSRGALCRCVTTLGGDIAYRIMQETFEKERDIKGPMGAYFIGTCKNVAREQGLDLGFASPLANSHGLHA
jgi:hypothetical protein